MKSRKGKTLKKTIQKNKKVEKSSDSYSDINLVKQVLFRPERYSYIRKERPQKGCVFCLSSQSISFDSLCVYQSEHSRVILNKFPYNSGHLLIIPKRHTGDILDLSDNEYIDIMEILRKSIKAATDIYSPKGINVGMNLGEAAGAGIPEHIHYHIIPRWSGDINFFPLIAKTKVVIETLEQTYEKYSEYFINLT